MPSSANDRQHGGAHYQTGGYQHWDWVFDVRLPYHPGNASKYMSRWRNKNGAEDLQKCVHYLDKTMELGKSPALNKMEHIGVQVFTRQFAEAAKLSPLEEEALLAIALGNYHRARVIAVGMLDSVMQEQSVGKRS